MEEQKINTKINLLILLTYAIIFHSLFLQFPLNNSLFQNIDTWFYIANFNDFLNRIVMIFSDIPNTGPFYPFKNYLSLGDPTFGSALLFNAFKILNFNDIWSYYLFMSLIFYLNAFTLFLFIDNLIKSKIIAFISGVFFTMSNFSFALMDNQNALVYFPLFLSILTFNKYVITPERKFIIASILFLSIELYFSSYIFLFNLLLLLIILTFKFKYINLKTSIMVVLFLEFLILVLPFFYLIYPVINFEPLTSLENQIQGIAIHSIEFIDFFRVIDGNILHNTLNDIKNPWQYNAKSIYVGFTLLLITSYGIFKTPALQRKIWLTVLVFSFIIAIGPYLTFSNTIIKMPLYYIYNLIPTTTFFRNTSRAYMLCLLAFTIFSAYGMRHIILHFTKGKLIIAIIFISFIVENVPYRFKKFNSIEYINPPVQVKSFFKDIPISNIAFLPSIIQYPGENLKFELNPFNREFIYWVWQSKIRHNILNGFSGYLNPERIRNNQLMNNLNKADNLNNLISENNLQYIVFFKTLTQPYEDIPYLPNHNHSDFIELVFEDKEITIFKINNYND